MDAGSDARDCYSQIQNLVREATYENCADLRRSIDKAIIESFKGIVLTRAAREAAVDLALECRALEQDLMLAGETPSEAWQDALSDCKDRVVLAANRMSTATVGCEKLTLPACELKARRKIEIRRASPRFARLSASTTAPAERKVGAG